MATKDRYLTELEDMVGSIGIHGVLNRLGVIFGQIYQRKATQHGPLWKKIGNILYSSSVRINALYKGGDAGIKTELFKVDDGESVEPEVTESDQTTIQFRHSAVIR